jgi:hypothetical protein
MPAQPNDHERPSECRQRRSRYTNPIHHRHWCRIRWNRHQQFELLTKMDLRMSHTLCHSVNAAHPYPRARSPRPVRIAYVDHVMRDILAVQAEDDYLHVPAVTMHPAMRPIGKTSAAMDRQAAVNQAVWERSVLDRIQTNDIDRNGLRPPTCS